MPASETAAHRPAAAPRPGVDDGGTPAVLIAYATNHGHTRLIAERIGAVLREAGLPVDLCDLGGGHAGRSPSNWGATVVAASVHAGRHQATAVRWARRHAAALAEQPSAFVSVSLTAADDTDEARAATQALIDEFAADTGWRPTRTAAVAGALQYREYDLPTRVLMRLIARRHHAPTDVSRDVDFTDWAAVERFAAAFAAAVESGARP